MDSLDARTLARMRETRHPLSDLPDEAIAKSSAFAWFRLGIVLTDAGEALSASLKSSLERLGRLGR